MPLTNAEKNRTYRRRHPERVKMAKKLWIEKNKDKHLEYKRMNYQKHKEKINARRKLKNVDNKESTKIKRREWYSQNRAKILIKQKDYRDKNKDKAKARIKKSRNRMRHKNIFWSIRKYCKKRGMELSITPEWIKNKLDSGACELTNISFDMEGKRTPNSPSVDRIDPYGGYTPGNCRMILWSINRALCNYGEEYMLMIFEKIIRSKKPGIFL